MRSSGLITGLGMIAILAAHESLAQDIVSEIPFDSIPGEVSMVGAAIGLEADTAVSGSVNATGEIRSDVGYRFPDATIQTSAAAGASITANQGLYSNTIADFSPPLPYTEVCFKGGSVHSDVHATSGSTAAGNCVPGDTGWLIERTERGIDQDFTWTQAKALCLMSGMRLLEPFEWQFSCDNAVAFQLEDMNHEQWEWVSNTAILLNDITLAALVFGNYASCSAAERGVIARSSDQVQSRHEVRCGR